MVPLTSKRTTHSATFVRQQNLIRGAFGNRRKRGLNIDSAMSPELIHRTNIRRALLGARAALGIEEFADFLGWYDWLRVAEFGGQQEASIGFDYLNGIIDGPAVPLAKEVAWIVARLRTDADTLARLIREAWRIRPRSGSRALALGF